MRLWLGALLAGMILCALGVGVLLWRSRSTPYDINTFTTVASLQPLTVRVSASGRVKPGQTVNLSPASAGIVERIYVEQGDQVRQGQLIARMESQDIRAQISQYQAAVAEAEAALADLRRGSRPAALAQARAVVVTAQTQVAEAQARLDLAVAELGRSQALFNRGAVARSALDAAAREYRSAQAGVRQAQSRVVEAQQRLQELESQPQPEAIAQAQARLAQAKAQLQGSLVRLREREIRAPFAGVITQKFATAGAFVTPTTSASEASSATSTAIVALAQDLEVLAEVPEANIGIIQLGQRVEVEADGFAKQIFRGRVKRIAPEAIERQNVTLFQVRIQLDSGKDQLRSNMTVNVAFITDQVADALVVPTVAVVTQRGQTGLLVPGKDQDIVFQPVTLGPQAGDKIQILTGLEAGDRVFINLPPGKSLDTLTLRQDR